MYMEQCGQVTKIGCFMRKVEKKVKFSVQSSSHKLKRYTKPRSIFYIYRPYVYHEKGVEM